MDELCTQCQRRGIALFNGVCYSCMDKQNRNNRLAAFIDKASKVKDGFIQRGKIHGA